MGLKLINSVTNAELAYASTKEPLIKVAIWMMAADVNPLHVVLNDNKVLAKIYRGKISLIQPKGPEKIMTYKSTKKPIRIRRKNGR